MSGADFPMQTSRILDGIVMVPKVLAKPMPSGCARALAPKGQVIPVIALAPALPSTKTPPKRGLGIYDSTACGGIFKIYDGHIDSTVDTIRAVRGAAQC